MLPLTTLHLQLPSEDVATTPPSRLVRVVVELAEQDLMWANSAFVFDTMVQTLENEWRRILVGGGAAVTAGVTSLLVPGVLRLQCELRDVELAPSRGGVGEMPSSAVLTITSREGASTTSSSSSSTSTTMQVAQIYSKEIVVIMQPVAATIAA
jgi:hypothetical protein